IGHAFCGSQKAAEAFGAQLSALQPFAWRAENFRADSRLAATEKQTSGRSIECEFDHLFLVATPFTIGHAFCGSRKAAMAFGAQVGALAVVWLARRKL
ncbi:MAG: hypothetical protein AB1813_16960, partial [Verrucomicrobiota bacterium]